METMTAIATTGTMTPVKWAEDPQTLDKIRAIAPDNFDAERFARALLTSVAKNPKIGECTTASVATCALECAQLGLYPGAHGMAYLIPRKARQRQGNDWIDVLGCTLQSGYKGLLHVARRASPGVHFVSQHVHEKDTFRLIVGERPHHEIYTGADRGKSTGVYAAARERDSEEWHSEWMSTADLGAHRDKYAPRDYRTKEITGPWVTAPGQMERKTVLRRLCNILPNMPAVDQLTALEDTPYADPTPIDGGTIDVTPMEPDPYGEELVARLAELMAAGAERAPAALEGVRAKIAQGARGEDLKRLCAKIDEWATTEEQGGEVVE